MSSGDDPKSMIDAVLQQHGSRSQFLFNQLERLSGSRQPCDITLYNAKPELDVRIEPTIFLALMYGAGAAKLAELLSAIELSNGRTVNFSAIWTINPMPVGGISEAALAAVDLSEGDRVAGAQGETIREMISQTYRCESRAEEDKYLRRFLAS